MYKLDHPGREHDDRSAHENVPEDDDERRGCHADRKDADRTQKGEVSQGENSVVSRPRRFVMDLSRVDPRIRLKLRLEVRKALVRSHLFRDDKVSIVDDNLIRDEINWSSADDADEFWLKVSEILEKSGLEDIDDSAVKFGADAVRVTL